MCIVLKNINSRKEILLEDTCYRYLYPVFFILNYQFDLDIDDNKPILLSDDVLHVLYERISNQLSFLLETCYQMPDQSDIYKRPSWYEKFVYNEQTYTVNYATSGLGRLMFTINSRLKFIKEIVDTGSSLSLTIVDA